MEKIMQNELYLTRAYDRKGYYGYLYKYENGDQYIAELTQIEWVKTKEGHVREASFFVPILVNHDTIETDSSLHGENKALKDEIKFLRQQISLLLERK